MNASYTETVIPVAHSQAAQTASHEATYIHRMLHSSVSQRVKLNPTVEIKRLCLWSQSNDNSTPDRNYYRTMIANDDPADRKSELDQLWPLS